MILLCPPEKSTQFHYPLDPKKYSQKALCTKTPLTRGVTGKTFTDTEKKNGLPVVSATENQKALNCVVLKYSIPVSEE